MDLLYLWSCTQYGSSKIYVQHSKEANDAPSLWYVHTPYFLRVLDAAKITPHITPALGKAENMPVCVDAVYFFTRVF